MDEEFTNDEPRSRGVTDRASARAQQRRRAPAESKAASAPKPSSAETDEPEFAKPAQARQRRRSSTESQATGAPKAASAKTDEPESVKPARALLEEILGKMGLTHVEVSYLSRSEGEYFEVTGPELASLIGRHGNTLEALNLIFNNILNIGVRNNRKYFTIDAEGYRARRADQLKNIALVSLERCIREKKPQALDPMLPSERKIVHLALAESPYVRTESEGVEPERRVVVFPR